MGLATFAQVKTTEPPRGTDEVLMTNEVGPGVGVGAGVGVGVDATFNVAPAPAPKPGLKLSTAIIDTG